MIISRTPFRISFFGGGTDYPAWYAENRGAVLATTINKYCYITCRYLPPFFEHKSRILYSRVENVRKIEEIQHPSVRESLRFMEIEDGVEVHHDGDLPGRSGLGSSSSFTVGFLHALHGLKGIMATKMDLAMKAIHVEQTLLKENVGVQDQILTAMGGLNRLDFQGDRPFQISPFVLPSARLEEFENHFMLFFTGLTRSASEIARDVLTNMQNRRRELTRVLEMVDEACAILNGRRDLTEFGTLLHESWQIKKSLSGKISNGHIDDMYERARRAGAIGGKLLGAGGGGFLLVFVRPQDRPKIKAALGEFLHVPFRFEQSGSQIIFYDRNDERNGDSAGGPR